MIVSVPAGRLVVAYVACPPLTPTVPIDTPPSRNSCARCHAAAEPVDVNVAVKVAVWPTGNEIGAAVTAVDVVACEIVINLVADTLLARFDQALPSPWYDATIVSTPTGKDDTANEALAGLPVKAPVPIDTVPSTKVTVPVGIIVDPLVLFVTLAV